MTRLIDHLRGLGLTNKQVRQALETGKICIEGVPTTDGGRDVTGLRVTYRPDAPRLVVGRDPVVLHRDAGFVVVVKPAGMLSVSAARRRREGSVTGFVRKRFGAAFPVHRLDEDTSGLMLVALDERTQLRMKEDLAARKIERRYLALVRHLYPPTPQTYESVLVRNRGDGKRGSASDDADEGEAPAGKGKVAITYVRRVERLARDASLVEAALETGRTHQVRIHLSEAGFPILGDALYATQGVTRAAPRLALHAWFLGLPHPTERYDMEWTAPLADDLERLRRTLGRPREALSGARHP
ncbi:MAG TPA: RluA family pseudouridine synthase [Myxococcota bacterium]|nr:RluA family pseudouridine synthase [Myxococcota bacterium]